MSEIRTLPELVALLVSGRVAARDAIRDALEAARRERADYNAYIMVHHETALAAAASADRTLASGQPPGPVHGLPVAVKDNVDEAGVACSAGSAAYLDRVPAGDAAVVAALRRAGAIVVGRTNMDELADGVTSANPHYGPVANPWRHGFHPGGSSGGSAVAVAAGSVPAALGTDTGGSVRIPAALCGVVGLKPSRGLLPADGVVPLSETLDHVGLLARTVDGVAALLAALVGGAPAAMTGGPATLSGLRVGVLEGFAIQADAAVGVRFDEVLRDLARAGAVLTPVRIPGLARGIQLLAAIYGPEAGRWHAARLAERPEAFGETVRNDLQRGLARDPARRDAALAEMEVLRAAVEQASAALDLLVSPTTPHPARPIGAADPHTYLTFTCPFNLTGQPAISLPMGLLDGLPVGLQLVGRPNRDAELLAAARLVERLTGGFQMPPARERQVG